MRVSFVEINQSRYPEPRLAKYRMQEMGRFRSQAQKRETIVEYVEGIRRRKSLCSIPAGAVAASNSSTRRV